MGALGPTRSPRRQTIARMLDRLWMSGRVGIGAAPWHRAPLGRLRALPSGGGFRRGGGRAARRGRGLRPRRPARRLHAGRRPRPAHHRPLHPPPVPAGSVARTAARSAGWRSGASSARVEVADRRGSVVGAAGASSSALPSLEPGSPDGGALAVRQPDLRPGPRRGALRLRPPPRDLHPGAEAALGLLRAPDPARGAHRRPRRSQGRSLQPSRPARAAQPAPEPGRRAPRATERAIRSLAHWVGAEFPG